MKEVLKGQVIKFGDNVDTDQIIPAEFLVTGDPKELAKNAFVKVRPDFKNIVKEGDMIVAGRNFGCGSSREHAPRALMGAGISCVIAKSFARIFFRNSINLGLTLIECDVNANEGDELLVELKKGTVKNNRSGEVFEFKPLPEFLLKIVEKGGLMEYVKEVLNEKNSRNAR
ncbi:MAG TPA: 3-isopropylmalate dehydratase small subunit [Methanofastidiosum sp.]|nr:3-isopropylmalate dehydratase small subunit [Methanofastidiosum sp.]HOC77282.1 3-isopropylmalate dehydratase small subunit [Methanofastidiosum sp.]HPA48732.1 3-isopropylmalate dehydratase small subunit [Methanofastidiosum sp.]HQK62008.1 3-isopropylmalate dehydratase small subunit [Methanofastidiosum sp.]HQM94117.1 3-isopropylmalate dehydratase small subunit [Methanofastidiosum sp.]